MRSGEISFPREENNNAFCFPNENLELDLRMTTGFIHWYMPILLTGLEPNHTYLQQSCSLSCRLSTVGESKPVFRWCLNLDLTAFLGLLGTHLLILVRYSYQGRSRGHSSLFTHWVDAIDIMMTEFSAYEYL